MNYRSDAACAAVALAALASAALQPGHASALEQSASCLAKVAWDDCAHSHFGAPDGPGSVAPTTR